MKIKKSVATLVLCGALFTVGATAAFAKMAYPGGGTWNYGENSSYVYSNYYHKTKTHKSSVKGPGYYVTSGWKSKDVWTFALHKQKKGYADRTYWSTK
ncbi:bacteriocin, lactococcin 972 family [Marininema mesophilum]|uniref:Bacteriocin, lactococcin 972 family n=1 Tax=Marininema mesophilum TaxID=1048340 RepID=A0A1H2QI73_9BACL|nr:lactococcin 972 family bacteriocin [Marininema mesophilum]SDW06852.1 bacteriocin, lactococcin 972 family [Marininema mesophilum]